MGLLRRECRPGPASPRSIGRLGAGACTIRVAAGARQLRPDVADRFEFHQHEYRDLGDILAERAQRTAALRTSRVLRARAFASRAAGAPAADAGPVSFGVREKRTLASVCGAARFASACAASKSSSRNSSCSIWWSSFSLLRPNCIRRSFRMSSFRFSISVSREISFGTAARRSAPSTPA